MSKAGSFRYLFLMRPPAPGAFPRDGLQEIGFDEGYAHSGHHYWGWADYNRKLTAEEIWNYELEEEAKMSKYHILPEYLSMWGSDCDEETIITGEELCRLAKEWEKPVEELILQLVPVLYSISLANKDCIFDSADLETLSDVFGYIPGHGGVYTAHITDNANGDTLTVSYNDDTGTYSRYNGWEWETITERDIRRLI